MERHDEWKPDVLISSDERVPPRVTKGDHEPRQGDALWGTRCDHIGGKYSGEVRRSRTRRLFCVQKWCVVFGTIALLQSLKSTSTRQIAMMYGLTMSLKNEIVKIAPKARVNCIAPGWTKTPMAEEALQQPMTVYRALAT